MTKEHMKKMLLVIAAIVGKQQNKNEEIAPATALAQIESLFLWTGEL